MTNPLTIAARIYAELRERIKVEYNVEDGDEYLEETLEGVTNLPEMLAALARKAIACEDQSEAIGRRVKLMQQRAGRLEGRAANLRAQIAWALEESGMKRIPTDALPELTVTMSAGKAPLIVEDVDVPREFCRLKYEPDKTAIRKMLETGERCLWARLGNPRPTLTIRSR